METNKNEEVIKKKAGRKALPKGFHERRILLNDEDLQRLNIILNIMFDNEEDRDKSGVEKTSMFFTNTIKEKFQEYNETGILVQHFSALATK